MCECDRRVLDHDTYSAHNAIGKVYIDLNPLLTRKKASIISGWYPIYDTMHGNRDLQSSKPCTEFYDLYSIPVRLLCLTCNAISL